MQPPVLTRFSFILVIFFPDMTHIPKKCTVVTFNESKREFSPSSGSSCVVGNSLIQETEDVIHLGILCYKYSSSSAIVKNVDRNLRGTFFWVN